MTSRCATCPSCKCSGVFEYLGDQRWPEAVAARLNMPAVFSLWGCPHCHTTVSETELLPYVTESPESPDAGSGDSETQYPLPPDLFLLTNIEDRDR